MSKSREWILALAEAAGTCRAIADTESSNWRHLTDVALTLNDICHFIEDNIEYFELDREDDE